VFAVWTKTREECKSPCSKHISARTDDCPRRVPAMSYWFSKYVITFSLLFVVNFNN